MCIRDSVNTDRNSQSSLTKNFDEADFIFTSGSTHRTSASMPQKPEGPYVYANGKQGKYLTVIDLDIKNNKDPISDLTSKEQKVKQLKNRLKRLQKKDPSKKLEDIYSGQDNILNLIKQFIEIFSFSISFLKFINNVCYFRICFLSILSKQVEHNKCPFFVQNVFVDLSISFLQIKHLNIGVIVIIV